MTAVISKLMRRNPDAVLLDSRVDGAIIGIGCVCGQAFVAIYSKKAIYELLYAAGITSDDIDDYYTGNFAGVCGGQHTPIIFDDMEGL